MAYARGLIPINSAANASTFQTVTCNVQEDYGTAIFVGDPVIVKDTGFSGPGVTNSKGAYETATGSAYFQTVNAAAAGGVIYGVVTSVEPTYSDLSKQYLPASTGGRVRVCRPTVDTLFKVGADAAGDQIELIDGGAHYDLVADAGSTVTGYSGFVLDSTSHATAAAQVYLVGIYNNQQDISFIDDGTNEQEVIWICSISEIQFAIGTLGVGVL